MIAKDTTTTVNFFVTDTDGLPSTGQASNITATISINGATATAISDTISEKGSGWYYFTHTFGTVGNVFIEFSATNCTIEPWEDEVINMAGSAPSASDIALAVWSYEDEDNILYPCRSIQMVEVGNTFYTPMVEGLYGGYDALVNAIWGFNPATLLSQTSAALRLVDIQDNAARPGDAMTLTAAYNAAKTASQFNASTDTVTINSTQAATMVTATGFATPANITAAQTAIINAMPSTTGLATSSDISTAQTAIINAMPSTTGLATGSDVSSAQSAIIAAMPDVSGLSTFDPSTDDVNVSTTSISDIQNGLATSSNVSTAQAAIIAAMPSTTGLATSTDVSTAQTAIINAMPSTAGLATSANVSAAQTAIINAMPSTSGLATSADITAAITEIETHGDENWAGGSGPSGGGITAEDVWKYSGTYGRTLTASPTDITTLATKTDLSSAQTAIINAMPDVSGLSTFDPSTDNVNVSATSIANIAAGIWGDVSEYTGSTKGAVLSTIASDVDAMPASIWSADLTDYSGSTAGHQIYNALNNCATSTDTAVIAAELEEVIGGVMNWYVTANTLTVYSPSNTVLKTYSITRDVEGNIVRIQPNN